MARIMGQKLSEVWGQPVIIESKPGAAGSIGMEFAARQPADGYTFVVGNLGPASVNPLITKVPYNMSPSQPQAPTFWSCPAPPPSKI
jgi:tripartite-type tricarboxylate transporter receptor subunit TctC